MSVFRLEIADHKGHFGTQPHQEHAVIAQVLADVSSTIRKGHPLVGEQPIMLNGDRIGSFIFGEKAHSYVGQR